MPNLSNKYASELSERERDELVSFLQKEMHLEKKWINSEGRSVFDVIAALGCFNDDSDGHRPRNMNTGLSSFKNGLRIIYENLLIIKFMNTQNLEFLQSNLK